MGLTRFYDRQSGKDGPVSGAMFVMPFQFTNGVTNSVYAQAMDFPAGMELEIININVQGLGVAGNPQITVGTAKAGTEIVAAVTATTNLGDLTLVTSSVTAGDIMEVRVTNDAVADAFDSVAITVTAYMSAPPTSELPTTPA